MAGASHGIFAKMVEESIAAQRADVEAIRRKRIGKFAIEDTRPCVDAVSNTRAVGGQAESIVRLHVDSVNAPCGIIRDLTKVMICL